jgi:hypothetical protein
MSQNKEIVHLQLYSCKQNSIYKLLVILLVIELHTVKQNFVAFFVSPNHSFFWLKKGSIPILHDIQKITN